MIYESKLGINNTTRNTDSYTFTPAEYSKVYNQAEETHKSLKTIIAKKLMDCSNRSTVGRKEDYAVILHTLNSVIKDINEILQ